MARHAVVGNFIPPLLDFQIPDISEYKYKVVLLGDTGVGKSNLHHRIVKEEYDEAHKPTIGVDYGVRRVEVGRNVVKLQVWDTAGQERFHALTNRLYMKGSYGILFVYDITKQTSFDSVSRWITLVEQSDCADTANLQYMLIGNKNDQIEERKVPIEKGRELADRHSMLFMETSAMNGNNITAAFRLLASEIHRTDLEKLSKTYENITHEQLSSYHQDHPAHTGESISLQKDDNLSVTIKSKCSNC